MLIKPSKCFFVLSLLLVLVFTAGCAAESDPANGDVEPDDVGEIGTLAFVADGEDKVREGMNSKESWVLNFDHAYITLADMSAYQTDPPYDTDQGWDFDYREKVELAGKYTVDLADPGADPVLVGEARGVPAGHYNALSWVMARADSGPSEGYALLLIGTAEKDGQVIDFALGIEREVAYVGGDFVGDVRKGILNPGESAEVEMTFHFDHLFGRDDRAPDDPINLEAFGFGFLAELAVDSSVEVNMADLSEALDDDDFALLEGVLLHFGHVGEGHCLAKFID